MWPKLLSDRLGSYGQITVDPTVYDADTIFRAAYWFTDRYFVFLSRTAENYLSVELRAKTDADVDLDRACAEFCNSLIDFRVRRMVAEETAGVREALVTKAFTETTSASKRA